MPRTDMSHFHAGIISVIAAPFKKIRSQMIGREKKYELFLIGGPDFIGFEK